MAISEISQEFQWWSSYTMIGLLIVGSVIGLIYLWYNAGPIVKFIGNSLKLTFLSIFNSNQPVIKSEICSIIPTNDSIPRVPSLFIAHLAFFFGYLLTNAFYLYYKDSEDGVSQININNRKFRSIASIVLLCLVYISIVITRLYVTECESLLGVAFTTSIFSCLGLGWYKLAEYCGLQLSDIYGISSSILPSSASKAPVVCIRP